MEGLPQQPPSQPQVSTPAPEAEGMGRPELDESEVEAQRGGQPQDSSEVGEDTVVSAPLSPRAPLAKEEEVSEEEYEEESVEVLLEGLEVHDQEEPMEEEPGHEPEEGGPGGGPRQ